MKIFLSRYRFDKHIFLRALLVFALTTFTAAQFIELPFGGRIKKTFFISTSEIKRANSISPQSKIRNKNIYYFASNVNEENIPKLEITNFAKNNIIIDALGIDPIFLQREICVSAVYKYSRQSVDINIASSMDINGKMIFDLSASGKLASNGCFVLGQYEQSDKTISLPIHLSSFETLMNKESQTILVAIYTKLVYGKLVAAIVYATSFAFVVGEIFLFGKCLSFILKGIKSQTAN